VLSPPVHGSRGAPAPLAASGPVGPPRAGPDDGDPDGEAEAVTGRPAYRFRSD